jgi:hypothetical protein
MGSVLFVLASSNVVIMHFESLPNMLPTEVAGVLAAAAEAIESDDEDFVELGDFGAGTCGRSVAFSSVAGAGAT